MRDPSRRPSKETNREIYTYVRSREVERATTSEGCLARVREGATAFDLECPGWWHRINVARLAIYGAGNPLFQIEPDASLTSDMVPTLQDRGLLTHKGEDEAGKLEAWHLADAWAWEVRRRVIGQERDETEGCRGK